MTDKADHGVQSFDPAKGYWEPAIPEPFSYGLFPWLWRRLTGWRDEYGRKADLFKPWEL
jgi:hypothetical protein